MPPVIQYRDIYKTFDAPVLAGVSLDVDEGETLVIVGPSGTGKSVLLKHAIGLLTPDEGDVIVDGVSINNASPEELTRVRRNVGYIFQNAALFDSLSVAENLYLAQTEQGSTTPLAATVSDPQRERSPSDMKPAAGTHANEPSRYATKTVVPCSGFSPRASCAIPTTSCTSASSVTTAIPMKCQSFVGWSR